MGKLRTGSVHRNDVQTCADIRIPDGGHEACRERIVCISEEQGAFPDGCTQKNIPDAAKRKDVVARRGRESSECLPLSPMSSTLAVRSYFVLLEGMRDAPGCRLAYNPRAVLRQRMVHEHCSFMSIFCWFARCDSNSAERIDRWWILLQVAQARCDPILEHSSAKKKKRALHVPSRRAVRSRCFPLYGGWLPPPVGAWIARECAAARTFWIAALHIPRLT